MKETVLAAIQTRFDAFAELVAELPEERLTEKLPVPRSKSLEEHYWCIVGARESYAKAIEKGEWSGFACSLTSLDKASVLAKLTSSAEAFSSIVQRVDNWTRKREELLLSLLEHEVMHEGQIIRHMHALGHELPASWKWA